MSTTQAQERADLAASLKRTIYIITAKGPTRTKLLNGIDALLATPPSAAPAMRQLVSVSSIDIERMLAECVPGGDVCDPQQVADAIRRYCDAWPAGQQAAENEDAALLEAAKFACDVLAELYAKYQTKIGPFASQTQLANVKLSAAIRAARKGKA
jgi:hypothetical protein